MLIQGKPQPRSLIYKHIFVEVALLSHHKISPPPQKNMVLTNNTAYDMTCIPRFFPSHQPRNINYDGYDIKWVLLQVKCPY